MCMDHAHLLSIFIRNRGQTRLVSQPQPAHSRHDDRSLTCYGEHAKHESWASLRTFKLRGGGNISRGSHIKWPSLCHISQFRRMAEHNDTLVMTVPSRICPLASATSGSFNNTLNPTSASSMIRSEPLSKYRPHTHRIECNLQEGPHQYIKLMSMTVCDALVLTPKGKEYLCQSWWNTIEFPDINSSNLLVLA